MAEFEAIGKALQIPQSVLNNIEKIDQKINLIASDSEKMATHFMSAMTRMGNGADGLLQKLTAIQGVINGLGSVNTGGLGNVGKGMGNTATQAEKAAASISEAAAALNRFVQTWKGSGRVTSMLDSLATREQVNLLRELNNQAMQTSRTLTQMNRENSLEARKKANETKIASQEETNATNRKMEALKRENSQTKINTAEYRNYVSALTMSEGTENSRIKKIERMNTVLSELQRKEALYANEIEIVRKKIEQLTRENDSLARSREKTKKQNIDERANTQALNAYNRAMAASEALVTQRINKIAKLRQAEEMLRNASGNYATQLNRISQEIARLNRLNEGQVDSYGRVIRSQRNLVNTSQQLTRQLALLFSVSQIEGYISKLIQVRGEFELQNTALAAMLNNKDQADRLFGQITELAVRSPFTIKELTTYTKSLAAYQVQYEDLYDTTKMLADVSAGLGVDMQRLILAFGQVKAANILRGTELRQFTEAGVNMLSELAKYYSELENRMVSVGEVQEMVTKRMVSFGDVEEVFKRITSAGGLFYNMQEKQADTLRGQMMNLQDQIDLMLNDIGKSNQTTISAIISLVKSVIENWKSIAQVMEPIASVLVLYLTTTKGWSVFVGTLPKLWGKVRNGIQMAILSLTAAGRAQQTFNKAAAGNAWLAIGAVVATIIWEVVNAIRAAGEEQRKYNAIVNEGSLKASELGANFERLADQAVNAADGSKEQKAALDELNRTYSGILSQDDLKIEKLREMKGAYDGVITAIYNKIEADTKENLLQEVNSTYGAEAVEALNDLAKRLEDFGISSDRARIIVAEFRKEWDASNISSASAYTKLQKIIEDFTGKYYELTEFGTKATDAGKEFGQVQIKALDDATTALTRYETKRNEILGRNLIPFRAAGGTEIYEQLHNQFEEVGKLKEEWEKENYGKFDMTIEFTEESKKQQIQAYQEFINDINERINSGKITGVNVTSALLVIEEAQKEIDKLNVSPMVKQIDELRLKFSQLTGIDFGKLNFTEMMPTDSFNEYIKGLDSVIKGYDDAIKVFDEAKSANEELPWMQRESLLQGMESEEELRARAAAVKAFRDAIYYEPPKTTTTGGSKNPELDKLKEQISLIEKAAKEYENYRKLFDEQTAQQKTEDAFRQAFENLGLDVSMDFDASGVIEALRNLFNTAGDEGNQILTEKIATKQTGVETERRTKEVEEYRKQIDELFASLSNYQELEKLGLNKELISQLFGINVSSINDVQTTFDKMKSVLKGYGDEGEKLISESEKKITDAQQKELQDRMKKYATYLTKQYSEIANIRIKLQKEMYEVDTLDMSDVQKQSIKQRLQDEANKQIQKLTWEDFKASDMYTQMFDDLDKVSTKGLDYMVERLEELKGTLTDLDPTELKEIIKAINDIKEEQLSRNPLKGIGEDVETALNFAKQRKELEEQITDEYEKQKELREQIPQQEQNVENARNNYGNVAAALGTDSTQAQEAKKSLEKQEKTLSDMNKDLSESEKKATNLKERYDEGAEAAANIAKRTSEFAEKIKIAVDSFSTLVDGMNSIFNMSDGFNDVADSLISFGNNMANTVSSAGSAFASFATGNIFGGITSSISAIGGLFSSIGSLFSIGDKKKERQIQRQLELVEDLQRAYEKLEEAIDNAYSIDQLNSASDQAEANLKQQAAALEEAIRLEEDKKKTDKDTLKEYQHQLEDTYEQLEKLEEKRLQTLGGFGSDEAISSAAKEFADAWLDAYRETGDGLDALNEKFDEFVQNILSKQLMLKGAEKFLKPAFDYIDIMLEDSEVTTSELDKLQKLWDSGVNGLNDFWKDIMEGLDWDWQSDSEGDSLTGLQRGIEGLSEQTGQALEALLESIRFFVSDENAVIHNIYNTLVMPTEENPFLAELRVQSEQLRLLYGLWNGVIKNVSGSGRAVNVRIV